MTYELYKKEGVFMINPSRCCGKWNAVAMFSKGVLEILMAPLVLSMIFYNLRMPEIARSLLRIYIGLDKPPSR